MRTARTLPYGDLPDRDPLDIDPLNRPQRATSQTETPQTETPLDRNPFRQRCSWTETPPRQRPPWTETPLPWTHKHLWKHYLRKLRLRAVTSNNFCHTISQFRNNHKLFVLVLTQINQCLQYLLNCVGSVVPSIQKLGKWQKKMFQNVSLCKEMAYSEL